MLPTGIGAEIIEDCGIAESFLCRIFLSQLLLELSVSSSCAEEGVGKTHNLLRKLRRDHECTLIAITASRDGKGVVHSSSFLALGRLVGRPDRQLRVGGEALGPRLPEHTYDTTRRKETT